MIHLGLSTPTVISQALPSILSLSKVEVSVACATLQLVSRAAGGTVQDWIWLGEAIVLHADRAILLCMVPCNACGTLGLVRGTCSTVGNLGTSLVHTSPSLLVCLPDTSAGTAEDARPLRV